MNDRIESSSEELKLGKGKWPVKDVEPAGQRSMCDTQGNTRRVLSATAHGEQTSACQETGSVRFWMTTKQREICATILSETTNAFCSGCSSYHLDITEMTHTKIKSLVISCHSKSMCCYCFLWNTIFTQIRTITVFFLSFFVLFISI